MTPNKSISTKRTREVVELRRLVAEGHLQEGYRLGESLLKKYKRDAEVHFMLGLIAEQTSQFQVARTHAQRSISAALHPDALFLLSRIERMEGNTDDSLSWCDQALGIRPDAIQLLIHRAGTLEEAGRIEEARGVVDPLMNDLETKGRSIPNTLRFELAKLLVQEQKYDNAIDLLDELIGDHTTPSQLRRLQHYLQAKAYDRSKQYDNAFAAATCANEINQLEFDPALYEQQVSMLIEQWTPERIERFPKSSCEAELPVFIAGMPRSGTSLIDQIIDAHPHAMGVGELSTIEVFAQQLSVAYNHELDPPKCFGRYDRFRWTKVAKEYVSSIQQQCPKYTKRVVNKALGNNKLVGLLACLFPKTRIIHAIRDPRDVAISCYMGGFNDQRHPWTTKIDWALAACEQSARMMDHWKSVLDVPILDVHYERLVSDPGTEIPRLIDFLGLEWDERCLESHSSRRTVRTLSYDQVNKPIYTSSVNRSEHYREHMRTNASSSTNG